MAFEDDLLAAVRLEKELAKPVPSERYEIGPGEFFDPWELFDAFAGTRSSDLDLVAIWSLEIIGAQSRRRMPDKYQLAAEFFCRMLSGGHYADLGPNGAEPNSETGPLWPEMIQKWRAFYVVAWGKECPELPTEQHASL